MTGTEFSIILLFALCTLAGLGRLIQLRMKRGSWTAVFIGARILSTSGEVRLAAPRIVKATLKVHRLEDEERPVAIVMVAKSPLSYQMMPIRLSAGATRELIVYLEEACGASERRD